MSQASQREEQLDQGSGFPQLDKAPVKEEAVVEAVKERYGRIAEGEAVCGAPSCCKPAAGQSTAQAVSRSIGYAAEDLSTVPEEANLGLGCGAPIQHLGLEPGEVVLDLGSGGGFDALLAARAVGRDGRVIGVDMTPEMIRLADENVRRAGISHVEFRQGRLEALPVEDATVDAVTSNCVINLVPDKSQVFREIARVLRPGGRAVIADILLSAPLPEALERDLLAYVGCVAGAMRRENYFAALQEAGLGEIEVLKDTDFLAATEFALPEEVGVLMERTGVRVEDIAGTVRSVTFRAKKT
jgi:SAM-dependent methyltransferase